MKTLKLSNILNRDISFKDEPQTCTLREYEKTRSKIIVYYSKLKGVMSIYQMGSVSVPGISDLDIIIVFDKGIQKQDLSYKRFLSQREQYIAGHGYPFTIDKQNFEKMNVFCYPSYLKLLHGKNLVIKNPSRVMENFYKLSYSIDVALTELVWLLNAFLRGIVPLRTALCHISSVKFDIENLEEVTGVVIPSGNDFKNNIEYLRLNWFDLDGKQRINLLVELGSDACEILFKIVKVHTDYFKKRCLNESYKDFLAFENSFYLADLNCLLCFKERKNFHINILRGLRFHRGLFSFKVNIPLEISFQYLLYGSHTSYLGWHLRRRIIHDYSFSVVNNACNDVFKRAINNKMNVLNSYSRFLLKAGNATSLFDGPWFGRSRLYNAKHFFWKYLLN